MMKFTLIVAVRCCTSTTKLCGVALHSYVNKNHAYSTDSNDDENSKRASKKSRKLEKPEVVKAQKQSEVPKKEKHSKPLRISTKKEWVVHDKNDLLNYEKIGGRKSKSLVEEVATHFHPKKSDTSRRWMAQADMMSRLNSISRNSKGKNRTTSRSDVSSSELMKEYRKLAEEKYEPKRPTELDMNEVSQYVEILLNSKERLNLFVSTDTTSISENDTLHPGYKTAIDWWEEWEAELDKIKYKSHYQEILEWTKEGKFPTLPVDNEVGTEEEQDTPFYKHVFLHEMLEDGILKQGPVRKFMESVILGLSNNPHLTVKEKEEHINWFKEYFKEKYDLLKTLGTIGDENAIAIDEK